MRGREDDNTPVLEDQAKEAALAAPAMARLMAPHKGTAPSSRRSASADSGLGASAGAATAAAGK